MHFDIYSIFNPPPSDRLETDNFKVSVNDVNGVWINLDEVNNMIDAGVIKLDKEALKHYVDSWKICR
jgi:hypothetical protein